MAPSESVCCVPRGRGGLQTGRRVQGVGCARPEAVSALAAGKQWTQDGVFFCNFDFSFLMETWP